MNRYGLQIWTILFWYWCLVTPHRLEQLVEIGGLITPCMKKATSFNVLGPREASVIETSWHDHAT